MADDIRVTGPVTVKSDSTSRVAFEMMNFISNYEESNTTRDRSYWLTLYSQCYKAANGTSLKYVLNVND